MDTIGQNVRESCRKNGEKIGKEASPYRADQEDSAAADLITEGSTKHLTYLRGHPALANPYQSRGIPKARSENNMFTASSRHPYANSDRQSLDSLSNLGSQLQEKSGWMLTSFTIAKSYFGVGSLAIPWGFLLCGYQLALAMITVNALLSFFSCWTLVQAQ